MLFIIAMIPVFLCGFSFLAYVVFTPAPLTVLVMGLDARSGAGFQSRPDAVMVMKIDPARLQVNLLSIPRDLHLNVPRYGFERVNTVNLLGEMESAGTGPALLTEAIDINFGVKPDRYVRLNFDGFVRMIDAVGGVNIDVERAIVDHAYPTPDGGTISIRFEPGWQHMDGERALMYARTRHADDDYARAARQQQVIGAVAAKLINPVHWGSFVAALLGAVDTDMTILDAAALAPPVLLSGGRFNTLVVNREYITSAEGVAVPNFIALEPWIREYLAD